MPRYQLGNDICSIDQIDSRVVIVEPDGTLKTEECANAAMAKTRFRILANQKLKAKWKPIADAPEKELVAEAAVQNARNPALEAALLEDPDNVTAWQVYGDWLQEQGDPRGTHIALRRAAVAAPKNLRVAEDVRKFEERHAAYLRAGLTDVQVGWGFLDVVRAATPEQLDVLGRDAGRFVRRIEIPYSNEDQLATLIDAIAKHAPRTLRELAIENETPLASLKPIEALLPRFRVLDLESHLRPACVEHLSKVPLPKLVELGISAGQSRADLKALLNRPGLDRVRYVKLYGSPTTDVCGVLAAGPLAARLEKLMIVDNEWPTIRSLLDVLEKGKFPKLGTLEMDLEAMYSQTIQKLVRYVGNVVSVPSRFATDREERGDY